eukprot:COSAG01_NODE_81_length_27820_cov_22.659753_23_plen_58_part_00
MLQRVRVYASFWGVKHSRNVLVLQSTKRTFPYLDRQRWPAGRLAAGWHGGMAAMHPA